MWYILGKNYYVPVINLDWNLDWIELESNMKSNEDVNMTINHVFFIWNRQDSANTKVNTNLMLPS